MVYHGGAREIRKGIIDFSYSTNPYYPKFIKRYLDKAKYELYPYCEDELEKALKSSLEGEVTIGAGITELLYMISYATRKVPSIIMKHTYGEYQRVSKLFGKPVSFINSLDPKIDDFLDKKAHTIFFANPNNPTGKVYDYVSEMINYAERNNSIVVLDESFIRFADKRPKYEYSDSLVVLRSFTKEYNIPGVRIGYAISSKNIRDKMLEYRMPWGIGAAGCVAIKAILKDRNYLKNTLPKVNSERDRIKDTLKLNTNANFFLAEVGDSKQATQKLAKGGILVRDCSSFGLPTMIRFSVRKPKENNALISELSKLKYIKQPQEIQFNSSSP